MQQLVLKRLLDHPGDGLDFDDIVPLCNGFPPHVVIDALAELERRGYVTLHASRPMWRPVRYEEQAA